VYLKIVIINVCRTAITHYNGLRTNPQKKEIVENMIAAYGYMQSLLLFSSPISGCIPNIGLSDIGLG
jgi:hypothetical protein